MSVKNNNEEKSAIALEGLKLVDDPEVGLNVVDLGLIYELDFNEAEKKVVCIMTLTTEFCPMGESIIENVKMSLETSFPNYQVDVFLTFQPPWTYDLISEDGHAFLGR